MTDSNKTLAELAAEAQRDNIVDYAFKQNTEALGASEPNLKDTLQAQMVDNWADDKKTYDEKLKWLSDDFKFIIDNMNFPQDEKDRVLKTLTDVLVNGGLGGKIMGKVASYLMDVMFSFTSYNDPKKVLTDEYYRRKWKIEQGDLLTLIKAHRNSLTDDKFLEMFKQQPFDDDWLKVIDISSQADFSMSEIHQLINRRIIKPARANELYKRIGFKNWNEPGERDALRYGPIPLSMLFEMKQRDIWTGKELLQQLEMNNWDTEISELMQKLEFGPLDSRSALTNHFRGNIDKTVLAERLKHAGIAPENQKLWIDASKPIMTQHEIKEYVFRNDLGLKEYSKLLKQHGYDDDISDNMATFARPIANPSDMIRFGVREVYSPTLRKALDLDSEFPEAFAEEMSLHGFSRQTALDYWAGHWNLPSPGAAYAMLHRGLIDESGLDQYLRVADYAPVWRNKMREINTTLIPRRALNTMLGQGVIDKPEAENAFRSLGYDARSTKLLIDSGQLEIAARDKEASKADILRWYRYDVITRMNAKGRLIDLTYPAIHAENFLKVTDILKDKDQTTSFFAADLGQVNDLKNTSKSEIIKSHNLGLLSREETIELLETLGYNEETAEFILTLEDAKMETKYAEKEIGVIEDLFYNGLISLDIVNVRLAEMGIMPSKAKLISDFWEIDKNAKELIADSKERVSTMTTITRWFKKGLITGLEYAERLKDMQYTDNDIIIYIREATSDE